MKNEPRMPTNQELIEYRSNTTRVPDIAELQWLARWMDSAFEIPGLNVRFGLDAILGLVPGLGDVVSSLISFYILQAASQRGVPRLTMMRMATNVLVDWGVGSVPLLGDVFDVYWKSNQKNVELLQLHSLANPEAVRKRRIADWLFLALLIGFMAVFLIGCLTIAYFLVSLIGSWIFPPAAKPAP